MAIGSYSIVGYQWLLMVNISVVIYGYFIDVYFIDGY